MSESLNTEAVEIHPSAVVEEGAKLGRGVKIGPFCLVGPNVELGDGCVLHNHVSVIGHTTIGANNELFQNVVIGSKPQDKKYKGEPTRVVIGNENIFRENVTIHPGTEVGGGVTTVGDQNFLLVGTHVAHDCHVGNRCVFANYTQIGGHVVFEDGVTVGGHAAFHHFVTVGRYSMVGGLSPISQDVPPFLIVVGSRNSPPRPRYINRVGLKRNGFSDEQILALKQAQMKLFSTSARKSGKPLIRLIEELRTKDNLDTNVEYLCNFLMRSFEEGRNGRYLESIRADQQKPARQ